MTSERAQEIAEKIAPGIFDFIIMESSIDPLWDLIEILSDRIEKLEKEIQQ